MGCLMMGAGRLQFYRSGKGRGESMDGIASCYEHSCRLTHGIPFVFHKTPYLCIIHKLPPPPLQAVRGRPRSEISQSAMYLFFTPRRPNTLDLHELFGEISDEMQDLRRKHCFSSFRNTTNSVLTRLSAATQFLLLLQILLLPYL